MICPTCSHENRTGAKFCEECATPLKRACASCGVELRPAAKFCDECGAPTAAAPVRSEPQPSPAPETTSAESGGARKVVTIVFADLAGSTALQERLDAEAVRRFMERYYEAMRAAVERHGGTVAKLLGDGVLAVFGIPHVAEDDAPRAVQASADMQRAFRELAEQHSALVGAVGLRVAVNTGEVVVGDETEIIGDPVNVAARLQEKASDGDIVIGDATQRLVSTSVTLEPLGDVALKGRAEAVKAYRLVSLERPAGVAATPFVGRQQELERITRVYDEAVSTPAARLAVLLGSPGLGKSRLIEEFVRRQSEAATVISAHCEASGEATFAPLADALREFLHIDDSAGGEALRAAIDAATPGDDDDRVRIVDGITALVAGSPAAPEETFFVVRRMLAALASQRPVVLVIDDLQWAEPLFHDLVEHLVQWGSGVPLLVLVGARPELRDARSSLATAGSLVTDVVTLTGLDAGAAMRLAANVIGAADLPAAIAAKVLASSEGNPLFVGELVRMLVQQGALQREGDRWTVGAGLEELEMPPTIHALLAARIERMRPEERVVLERAAVVGRHFSRSAVAELLPGDGADLDARLEALRRSELIERDTGWFLGEPVLRFHHMLIRDAAYRRVLKGTRVDLHARFADWIEARAGDSVEHDETIGWHLEQSHQNLVELGPIDDRGRALGERAAHRLSAAGRRALARDDVSLAANLLTRARARLDGEDSSRPELLLDCCEALLAAGEVGPAASVIDELERFGAESERLHAWHVCFAGQLTAVTAPQELRATVDAVAEAAQQLASLDDSAGEAKAHFVHAQTLARLGKVGACEAALDHALAAARKAGDRRRANAVLAGAPLAALWGPSPVTRASGRCLDVVRVLRITQGAPAVEAVALSCQGVLEALRGRTDAARRMIASSRKMVEDLGISHRLFESDVFAARVDLLEGDAATAERGLRAAYEGLRELGHGIDAAQAAALLARALLVQDRAAEAEELSHQSEALAGDDLQAAIAWRGVRAEALARRGETRTAVELAEAAVAIAAATDALLDHADARLALAAALRAASRAGEADAEERRAHELWEAKGATLLAERAASVAATTASEPKMDEAAVASDRPRRSHLRPNAAIGTLARADAAIATRDTDELRSLFAEHYSEIEHPTGSSFGRDGVCDSVKRLLRSHDAALQQEPLATLGEHLALSRRTVRATATGKAKFDVGPYENEVFFISEVDARGLLARGEAFGADRLGDAVARLYQLYAEQLPEGPQRERAAAIARSLPMTRAGRDIDGFVAVLAEDVEIVDHRTLGTWNVRGREAMRRHMRSLHEVADDVVLHDDDVLALEPNAALLRRMHTGTEREGGGAYERPFLALLVFGNDGLVTRWEWFDVGREAEALARFDEVVAEPAPSSRTGDPFANAATRAVERGTTALAARNWEGLSSLFAADFRNFDRRALFLLESDREQWLVSLRQIIEMTSSPPTWRVLATRGDRLALVHMLWQGADGDVGPSEIDWTLIVEVNERDEHRAVVTFDFDALDAAYAELDRRWEAGEAAQYERMLAVTRAYARAFDARDWDAFTAQVAPEFVRNDHRVLGWGDTSDLAFIRETQEALFALAPDVRMRPSRHVRMSTHACLMDGGILGTREGGEFEIPGILVTEIDDLGKVLRVDVYDPEQVDAALVRFEEIDAGAAVGAADAGPPAATAKPSPALTAMERWQETYRAGFDADDWDAMRRICTPDLQFADRRRMALLSGGSDLMVASARERAMVGMRPQVWPLGTAGARIGMWRMLWSGGPDDGRVEVEYHALMAVDETGLINAISLVEADDRRALQHEAWQRWTAIEPAAKRWVDVVSTFADSYNDRDLSPFRPLLAEDFVCDDQRRTGFGRLTGPDTFLDAIAALWELAPDARIEFGWHWPAYDRHAAVTTLRRYGTVADGGGPFESDDIILFVMDDGLITRIESFEAEALDAALARFEQLSKNAASTPSTTSAAVVKANAASALLERWQEIFNARDWDAQEEQFVPDGTWEDRRRLVRLSGGMELMFASIRERAAVGAQVACRLLATAGERVAIARMLYSGGPTDGRFEIEVLLVLEVDEEGRVIASVQFDPDDLVAAKQEAWKRWVAIESAAKQWVDVVSTITDSYNERDLSAFRALLAEDFVCDDHRRTGFGRLTGPDSYLEAIAALWELAPDVRLELGRQWPAYDRRAAVTTLRRYGTVADGGPFESDDIMLLVMDDGLITRVEMFELDALDAALARFEELTSAATDSEPVGIAKENAARALIARFQPTFNARDWDALQTLFAPDSTYEDRQRLAQVSGGLETLLVSLRERARVGARLERFELLATAGPRVAVHTVLWVGGTADDRVEWEFIVVQVADEADRIAATITFDLEDADDALAEARARWVAIDPLAKRWVDLVSTMASGFNDRDLSQTPFAQELIGDDHRRTGFGRIEGGEAYRKALEVLFELAPEQRVEFGRHWPAYDRHAAVTTVRRWGTIADGGPFESDYLILLVTEGGLVTRIELFETDALDAALARFEELRPDPLRIPPNAATRAYERMVAFSEAEDWDALRALCEPISFDDRRPGFRVAVDCEGFVTNMQFIKEVGFHPRGTELLATAGDRLMLQRNVWTVSEHGHDSEVHTLEVFEVDEQDRIVAYVAFDPAEPAVASQELRKRWVAIRGDGVLSAWAEFLDAWNDHDIDRLRTLLPKDYDFHDHRRTGIGQVQGEDYLTALKALYQLSPDVRLEVLYVLETAEHGWLGLARWVGTNTEGGEFEAVYFAITRQRGDQVIGVDLFEPEDLDAARARFEELRAEPKRQAETQSRRGARF